jgi:cytochrome c-type biogenesis protein CcmH/NrfF
MTFEEYYRHYEIHQGYYMDALKHAWDCASKVQEKRIDELEDELHCVRAYNDELERWIAYIADDHPQIPDWIQQSARSLLAQAVA